MILTVNKSIQSSYHRKMRTLVNIMNKEVSKAIKILYKKESKLIKDDAVDTTLSKLIAKFKKLFAQRSTVYADQMTKSTLEYVDKMLSKGINTAREKNNPQAKYFRFNTVPKSLSLLEQIIIKENVALIKSIPMEYLEDVEKITRESLAMGRDLKHFTKQLTERYNVCQRRAEIIARDQTSKTMSFFTAERSVQAGITKAVWRHSGAGKVPRKSHQKASGKIFNLNEGLIIDGEYLQPGQAINCRCYYDILV